MSVKVEKFNFSHEEDEKLIEALAPHPALYDLKHELYKDQRAKDNIWKIISDEIGRSVSDCKKRWKNIKDTYDRRLRENNRTGSEAPPLKKTKKWALQERLAFLQKAQDTRKAFCNIVQEAVADDEDNADADPDEEITDVNATQQETNSIAIEIEDVPHCSNISPPQTNTAKNPPLQNPKKSNYREKICAEMDKRAKDRERVMQHLLRPEEETDEIDLFFKSIAKTVKSFPLHLKQRAKLETLSLISNIELDMWSSRLTSISGTNFSSTPSPTQTGISDGASSHGFLPLFDE